MTYNNSETIEALKRNSDLVGKAALKISYNSQNISKLNSLTANHSSDIITLQHDNKQLHQDFSTLQQNYDDLQIMVASKECILPQLNGTVDENVLYLAGINTQLHQDNAQLHQDFSTLQQNYNYLFNIVMPCAVVAATGGGLYTLHSVVEYALHHWGH